VIQAVGEGYEVYFVTDSSGGVSLEAHEVAMHRMIQAGAVPITWGVFAAELQRDWACTATVPVVAPILIEHSGVVGSASSGNSNSSRPHKPPYRKASRTPCSIAMGLRRVLAFSGPQPRHSTRNNFSVGTTADPDEAGTAVRRAIDERKSLMLSAPSTTPIIGVALIPQADMYARRVQLVR
jgi:hypothetical protein